MFLVTKGPVTQGRDGGDAIDLVTKGPVTQGRDGGDAIDLKTNLQRENRKNKKLILR